MLALEHRCTAEAEVKAQDMSELLRQSEIVQNLIALIVPKLLLRWADAVEQNFPQALQIICKANHNGMEA